MGLPKVKRDKFSVFNFLTMTDSGSGSSSGGTAEALSQGVSAVQHDEAQSHSIEAVGTFRCLYCPFMRLNYHF